MDDDFDLEVEADEGGGDKTGFMSGLALIESLILAPELRNKKLSTRYELSRLRFKNMAIESRFRGALAADGFARSRFFSIFFLLITFLFMLDDIGSSGPVLALRIVSVVLNIACVSLVFQRFSPTVRGKTIDRYEELWLFIFLAQSILLVFINIMNMSATLNELGTPTRAQAEALADLSLAITASLIFVPSIFNFTFRRGFIYISVTFLTVTLGEAVFVPGGIATGAVVEYALAAGASTFRLFMYDLNMRRVYAALVLTEEDASAKSTEEGSSSVQRNDKQKSNSKLSFTKRAAANHLRRAQADESWKNDIGRGELKLRRFSALIAQPEESQECFENEYLIQRRVRKMRLYFTLSMTISSLARAGGADSWLSAYNDRDGAKELQSTLLVLRLAVLPGTVLAFYACGALEKFYTYRYYRAFAAVACCAVLGLYVFMILAVSNFVLDNNLVISLKDRDIDAFPVNRYCVGVILTFYSCACSFAQDIRITVGLFAALGLGLLIGDIVIFPDGYFYNPPLLLTIAICMGVLFIARELRKLDVHMWWTKSRTESAAGGGNTTKQSKKKQKLRLFYLVPKLALAVVAIANSPVMF